MNLTTKTILALATLALLSACKTQQEIYEAPVVIEEELLDTLVVSAPIYKEVEVPNDLPVYRASATRKHDLLHTKLELSFDWEKQYVNGKAELTLRPFFYPTDQLVLDAKVFDIHSVTMDGNMLEYDYDLQKLSINLGRKFTRDEKYTIQIDYTAKPNEGPSGGSAAITSDKGLFFINPLADNPNKPRQIWTQGETENSSRWFPTIDKPNERCSQEIYVTVDASFSTLSNGILVNSTPNPDGTRTDYWKQDAPHAPYLFMLGIGEYAVVKEEWNGKPLMYYVEQEFEDDAKAIFNHTPEMLSFFSEKLNYNYPWDKYAQIVCRDYVSGAMENTGAVVFGEFVQKTTRELLDSNNDDIVAHELIHHWFGDLVTCESWSNLSLNEGFATYGEYMWREYKYGHDNAEKKRLQDLNGYLMSSSQGGTHDLIHFKYDDKEQMFDAHSYNKGGLIVHMLRSYIGDDAFFTAIGNYLKDHEFSDVEAHELRLAFEDTVGEDLNWFFNQWFYDKGHPILKIEHTMIDAQKLVRIDVRQTQDAEDNPPVFKFPVETALYYASGKKEYRQLWMDQREKSFELSIEADEMPVAVVFDGKHDILAVTKESRTEEEHVQLFLLSDEYADKLKAVKALTGSPNMTKIIDKALNDNSPDIRAMAVASLNKGSYENKLRSMALSDESSSVRASALKNLGDPVLAEAVILKDQSFWVLAEALNIIALNDQDKALTLADKLTEQYYKPLTGKISEIYANTGQARYLDFFEENLSNVSIFSFFNYMNQYTKLAKSVDDPERLIQTAQVLKALAIDNSNNYFKKYSATNFIRNLISTFNTKLDDESYASRIPKLKEMIQDIVQNTTDQRLKSSFQEYLQP